ncbi:MAG TPA: peptidylprolyl isomerase [Candidatus Goldiibacteriota bacterium]|nr:peptidylprolyl isomerase [Candidatus Goldiibacteriota bacterium]
MKKTALIAAAFALAVFAGCETTEVNVQGGIEDASSALSYAPGGVTAGDAAQKQEKEADLLSDTAAPLDSETIAIIGKYVLTRGKYNVITAYMKQKFNYTLTKDQEREFLEYIVNKKLMSLEGRALGYGEKEDLKIKYEWDFDDLVSHEYFVNNIEKKSGVTQAMASDYYAKNKGDFVEIKAQHIMVKSRDMAKSLHKRLLNGEDFDELAKKYSEDETTKANAGNLGYFTKGVMVQEFEDAAFALGKDGISEPVKTAYGWHIIKVLDKRQISFDDSKDRIMKMIREKKAKEVFDSEINSLKKKYKVQVNKDLLK